MQTRQQSTRQAPPEGDKGQVHLPATRIGLVSGLVAILCCVGPAALALLGVIGGATAYTLATDLYVEWGWWFRAAGLLVAGVLVWVALRRRDACHVDGVKRSWRSLVVILIVGVVTYGAMYALTTWLGTLV